MSEEKKESHHASSSPTGRAALLARPNVLSLEPYRCARDDYDTGTLLDANENALGPASLPTNSLVPYDNSMELERYPCPYQRGVKQLLCDYRNSKTTGGGGDAGEGAMIVPENVFCGVGSDEAIDLLIRIFCRPGRGPDGDAIMITPPTYGMYKVCANVNDVEIQAVPLTPDFDLRVPEMLRAATPRTKLVFVCSPGNPTGKSVPLSDIRRLASSPLLGGLVVVDEAYVDFSSTPSATSLVAEFDNVVVLQTLSKAFGLAGIRCGFAIGPPDVIRLMNNVKAPYNVNKLTSDAATNALRNTAALERNVGDILAQRERVAGELGALDFVTRVYPSDANFLLFRVKQKANELYKIVSRRGLTRDVVLYGLVRQSLAVLACIAMLASPTFSHRITYISRIAPSLIGSL
jgi:histidinol-phosphate aminotransferase